MITEKRPDLKLLSVAIEKLVYRHLFQITGFVQGMYALATRTDEATHQAPASLEEGEAYRQAQAQTLEDFREQLHRFYVTVLWEGSLNSYADNQALRDWCVFVTDDREVTGDEIADQQATDDNVRLFLDITSRYAEKNLMVILKVLQWHIAYTQQATR